MKGSNIRTAEKRDAENVRQLYQLSIRCLGSEHYSSEQIERWADRPVEAFERDIQETKVVLMEFQGRLLGFAQVDPGTAEIRAVYVHPDYARQNIGSFLLMWFQIGAFEHDLPRLTVNATLNAVEFFRAREFTELGPDTIALADGTVLASVRMEHRVYEKIEFGNDQSLRERVFTSLNCDDHGSRRKAMQGLKEQTPAEVLDIIVSLLNHPEQKIRRRAGGELGQFSMLHEEPVNVGQKADELVEYLQQSEDPRVRLSCVVALMPVQGPSVDRAFLRALADSEEKIVCLASREVGDRCGAEGTEAVRALLNHRSWQVRLIACITLIVQKTADQQVVATLEGLSQEPEAAEHDAWERENADLKKDLVQVCGGDEAELEGFSTMASILEKAREVAALGGGR